MPGLNPGHRGEGREPAPLLGRAAATVLHRAQSRAAPPDSRERRKGPPFWWPGARTRRLKVKVKVGFGGRRGKRAREKPETHAIARLVLLRPPSS